MKEFMLTQSYISIGEMLNSGEMAVYQDELKEGNIDKYAIVSRIGNRYDINGNKIAGVVDNPFINVPAPVVEVVEEKKEIEEIEEIIEKVEVIDTMKYAEIEALIDAEINKAVEGIKAEYEQKLADLKFHHEREIAEVGAKVKAELLAKLNA